MSHDNGLSPFREHASGLIVPDEISREREVWTHDEYRIFDRAVKLLATKELKLYLRCTHDGCTTQEFERVRLPDGGVSLRCGHKDRVISTKL